MAVNVINDLVSIYRHFTIYRWENDQFFVPGANKLKYHRTIKAAERAIDKAIQREK